MADIDVLFFKRHPDRQCHIRVPAPGEFSKEFGKLGPHNLSRRRIIVWAAPRNHQFAGALLRVPFLKYFDESLEDTDDILLPILKEIMLNAKNEQEVG